ncbi:neural cell adhesion molecule 2-like [Chaetodon trifascialis]|uniref:neural cell adhesion molecule 2-like n=1 Tax=Chaetodon trifascialis TaxID=109706 RepID=UPI0039951A91
MLTFMIFCHVWILQTVQIRCRENSTVIRLSVPEDHHVSLQCGGSAFSDVVWTHQNRRVAVTRQDGYETNEDPRRYLLLPDGGLRLLRLHDSDGGEYQCNQQLVAELQVLTGHHFVVSAGRTLLLPCGRSSKPRQRWFHRRDGGKREVIFTWFRNGTMKPEREGSRLSYDDDALQIQDLRLEDGGQYQCNGKTWTRVTVLTAQPEPTSTQQTTSTPATPATPAVTQTDELDREKKEKKRPENALLILAVVGFGLTSLLMAAVCVLLTSMKCRRRRRRRSPSAVR